MPPSGPDRRHLDSPESGHVTADPGRTDSAPRWRLIGPGLVVAATGVGAADLVATLIAGSKFGYTLMWAAVLGCVMKISLAEAAGRCSLATGRTLFEGWRASGTGRRLLRDLRRRLGLRLRRRGHVRHRPARSYALFPALGVKWLGHRLRADRTGPRLVQPLRRLREGHDRPGRHHVRDGRARPRSRCRTCPGCSPGSSRVSRTERCSTCSALVGGVGGTITLAAYGYWVSEKGWSTPRCMRVMRLDNRVAYVVTGIFVVATLIVGAELLHSSQIALTDRRPRAARPVQGAGGPLRRRDAGKLFLVGFFAAAISLAGRASGTASA